MYYLVILCKSDVGNKTRPRFCLYDVKEDISICCYYRSTRAIQVTKKKRFLNACLSTNGSRALNIHKWGYFILRIFANFLINTYMYILILHEETYGKINSVFKIVMLYVYTYKSSHFANKLKNARTRITDYTFGISTRVI